MNRSHQIIEKGFELAIDANNVGEDYPIEERYFELTMGSGFTQYGKGSVNVQLSPLNIDELIKICARMIEIVKYYDQDAVEKIIEKVEQL